MCPNTKSRAASAGTPAAMVASSASRTTDRQVSTTVSVSAGSRMAICSTVMRCDVITGANMARARALTQGIVRLAALHQRANDVLFGDAPEKVGLRRGSHPLA